MDGMTSWAAAGAVIMDAMTSDPVRAAFTMMHSLLRRAGAAD
jgi:hypothetical protein